MILSGVEIFLPTLDELWAKGPPCLLRLRLVWDYVEIATD